MSSIDTDTMRKYLNKSISSINENKVNGLRAEIDLRNTLADLGYQNNISQGGWIARNVGNDVFGNHTCVLFPETIRPSVQYPIGRKLQDPPLGLHTICSTMHQIGVSSYYCTPYVAVENDYNSIQWEIKQLGIPIPSTSIPLNALKTFSDRKRKHAFLRYKTNSEIIPDASIAEEFTKEHLRVSFQNYYMCEISDIDGIFWGQQYTYPLEIKEKTVASDKKIGDYFGLDIGPFVKLAFYAAKKGNLHSLFFVREIDNVESRQLVDWWFISYDKLAQYASWISIGGGKNMQGGRSTVVKIPRAKFSRLNANNLSQL